VKLENELSELRSEFKNHDKKLINSESAFASLKLFNEEYDSQPQSVQAQIIEDTVREIRVYENKVEVEFYGHSFDYPKNKKTRPEALQLLDGCSYRIQYGGRGRD
jgi:hypothetical protein